MSKTSAKRIAAIHKQAQALRLRTAGATYDQIAQQLGYQSKSGAHKAVCSALHATINEPANDFRLLELARLDQIQLAHWPAAIGTADNEPNPKAATIVLKASHQRCQLLGAYAPTKITTPDGQPIQLNSENPLAKIAVIVNDPELSALHHAILERMTTLRSNETNAKTEITTGPSPRLPQNQSESEDTLQTS